MAAGSDATAAEPHAKGISAGEQTALGAVRARRVNSATMSNGRSAADASGCKMRRVRGWCCLVGRELAGDSVHESRREF